jgi:hypothetical protein
MLVPLEELRDLRNPPFIAEDATRGLWTDAVWETVPVKFNFSA